MKELMTEWRKFLKESKQLPNLLYHGTTEVFDKFDTSKSGRRDSGNLGRGIYLSTDSDMAMSYAEENARRFDGELVDCTGRAGKRKRVSFGTLFKAAHCCR